MSHSCSAARSTSAAFTTSVVSCGRSSRARITDSCYQHSQCHQTSSTQAGSWRRERGARRCTPQLNRRCPMRRLPTARRVAALVALLPLLLQQAASATVKHDQHATHTDKYWALTLPRGSQPEGVAKGAANDLWVACLSGAIIHVDLRTKVSTIVHKEHGVHLSGLKFCKKQQALFVAGTVSGKGYVFHVRRVPVTAAADKDKGGSQVSNSNSSSSSSRSKYVVIRKEVLDFSLPSQGYINDVALTPERAYFTNSFKPVLHWVPREHNAAAGAAKRPLHKVGLGHFFDVKLGQFHANGIATFASKPRKDVLLLANTHRGNLYSVTVSKAPAANATSVRIAALPAAGSTATAALKQAAPRAVAAATAAAGAARVVAAEAMPALAQASQNVAQLLGLHKHATSSSGKQALKTAAHKAVQPAAAQGVTHAAALAALLRGKLLELSSNSSSGEELMGQLSGGADNNQLADDAAVLPSSQQQAANGSSSGSGHVAPQPAMVGVAAHSAAKPHSAPGSKLEQQQRLVQQARASAHSLLKVTQELQAAKATVGNTSSSTVSHKPVDSKAVASEAVTGQAASSKAGSHVAVSSTPVASSSQASSGVAPAVAQPTPARASNKPDAHKMMQSLLHEVHDQMAASSAEARKASAAASAPSHQSVATASKHAAPLASKAEAASNSGHNAHTFMKQLADGVVAKLPSPLREAASKARLTAQRIAAKATEVAHGAPAARALLGVQGASGMFHEQLGSDKRASPMQWSAALADSVADKLGIARHGSSSSVTEAEVEEIRLPNVPGGTYTKRLLVDGLWVPKNASTVFVVDNYNSRVWGLDVRQGLSNATLSCVWQGPELQVPTTLTMQEGRLWVVNAHLDTCFPFLPCPGHSFELLGLEPDSCQPFAPSREV